MRAPDEPLLRLHFAAAALFPIGRARRKLETNYSHAKIEAHEAGKSSCINEDEKQSAFERNNYVILLALVMIKTNKQTSEGTSQSSFMDNLAQFTGP